MSAGLLLKNSLTSEKSQKISFGWFFIDQHIKREIKATVLYSLLICLYYSTQLFFFFFIDTLFTSHRKKKCSQYYQSSNALKMVFTRYGNDD